MSKPKVTVLMSVYNGEKYLKDSISSILGQTFSDFEFFILNDGSTDNSLSVIQSFNDARIRLINSPNNIGVIKTLNKGIEFIQGEYVARMDCDDICAPKRLEKEVALLDATPQASVIVSQVALIDTNGKEIGFWSGDIQAKTNEDIHRILPNDNCIANSTVLIRSSVLKKYKYNANQKTSEDWDLWLRMASNNERFLKINEVLVKYRIHTTSITVKFNYKTVYLKKISVQLRFCLYELKHLHFNKFNFLVLKNSFLNCLKHLLNSINPNTISALIRIYKTNIVTTIVQLVRVIRFSFSQPKGDISLFFFFPFYHIGGAEKVHTQILQSVADKKQVVFITGISSGKGFYDQFKESADIIEIGSVAEYPLLHKLVRRILSRQINKYPNPVVFGCNSLFYYQLIPGLNENIKCIDLIHAFVNYNEPGSEYWSLPVADRINKRVVINKKTIDDYRELYSKNNKESDLLNRIEYIPNFIDVTESSVKPKNEKLNIIYVGRNSPEKRVYLVGRIAQKVLEKKANAEFILVGDMRNALLKSDEQYCKLTGEISDSLQMRKIYEKADVLLLTSSREGFPMVIMEAMANHVVVITTNVGGISEHITNNETGILINANGEDNLVDDFVDNIINLSQDRDKLSRLSKNAYAYAKANFSKSQFINAYRKILLTKEG